MLGDTHSAHDLGEEEVVVIGNRVLLNGLLRRVGRHGVLLVGEKAQRHDELLTEYSALVQYLPPHSFIS